MNLIDLHVDTVTAIYYDLNDLKKSNEFAGTNLQNFKQNSLQVDVEKLKKANSIAQFFVIFINYDKCIKLNIDPWCHFEKLYQQLVKQLNLCNANLALATNHGNLKNINNVEKIAAFIALEEGGFINDIKQLDFLYDFGVRYITLLWNYETSIGFPTSFCQSGHGLKPFGFEMVHKMNELGILVDVSHMSDVGVLDVLEVSNKPIIASHSNARSIFNHKRNLPDDLIRKIADNGGVVGVNFYPEFLGNAQNLIMTDDIVQHIKHIYKVGGEDLLAIGSDFDGFPPLNKGGDINDIADIYKIEQALYQEKFLESHIEKIFYKNVERIIRTI